ncbi:PurM, N-terminal-like protein [Mycena sp. CBHHK59/15]|nr:PurM, N-terminal-like protein [Mycena sp. CBHHK59/15]
MLLLPGLSVLSKPKREACLRDIQKRCSTTLEAHNVVFVTPRPGSVSPWSSKATDISAICNLGAFVERLERGVAFVFSTTDDRILVEDDVHSFSSLIHDRMTQVVRLTPPDEEALFSHKSPRPLRIVDLTEGLALAADEMDYLVDAYGADRNPTMQNSLCSLRSIPSIVRHKIFNASWTIDGNAMHSSLFQMIRNTEKISGANTISAYSDNAAVLHGHPAPRFSVTPGPSKNDIKQPLSSRTEDMPILIKVETHNHPTAVSPYPGAATGSGGEIRDEGAVGRGSKPKAGLSGFTVSNLLIPGFEQPWETDFGRPLHIASALDIMIEGPLGASAFNNEFGRPALAGYFRTFAERVPAVDGGRRFAIIVLGGPGLLIGFGASSAELDFASVQRDNPEMQRRCQQVIDACVALGEENPIESIHDVGAGGLSNALPELVHDSGLGAIFEIRDVLERYVLAISPDKAAHLPSHCPPPNRYRSLLSEDVIRLKMSTLFGKPPKMSRSATTLASPRTPFDSSLAPYLPSVSAIGERLTLAVNRVLRLPSVASKSFLITIGDSLLPALWPSRTVAVTRSSYGLTVLCGEAMAMGERTPLALVNPAASARIAVAEALTNLAAAHVGDIARVKLSANWMCAASKEGEGASLYAAVQAVGMELDSMSMSMKWREGLEQREVSSPLSLIVTAFAPVEDLRTDVDGPTILVFSISRAGRRGLAGPPWPKCSTRLAMKHRDVEDPALVKAFFQGCQAIRSAEPALILAYHDRSDGGLFTTVAEMAFAGHVGVRVSLDSLPSADDPIPALFNEELGAVVQIHNTHLAQLKDVFAGAGFPSSLIHVVGEVNMSSADQVFSVVHASAEIFTSTRQELQQMWAETSFKMQIRPHRGRLEYRIFYDLKFSYSHSRSYFRRPKVAILREQGWGYSSARLPRVGCLRRILIRRRSCAGKGWAHSILLNATAREEFAGFFQRDDTFTLAVCNGVSVPQSSARNCPANRSERFEARVTMVEVVEGDVTRSSGRASFADPARQQSLEAKGLIALRYVDSHGAPTEVPGGLTGVQTPDGRVLALMPHPERVVALESNSWYPATLADEWKNIGPWFQIFQNARKWCH